MNYFLFRQKNLFHVHELTTRLDLNIALWCNMYKIYYTIESYNSVTQMGYVSPRYNNLDYNPEYVIEGALLQMFHRNCHLHLLSTNIINPLLNNAH